MNNIKNIFVEFDKCINRKCNDISSTKELIKMQLDNFKKVQKSCSKKHKKDEELKKCINKEQTKYLKSNKNFKRKSEKFKKCGEKLCKKEIKKIHSLFNKK